MHVAVKWAALGEGLLCQHTAAYCRREYFSYACSTRDSLVQARQAETSTVEARQEGLAEVAPSRSEQRHEQERRRERLHYQPGFEPHTSREPSSPEPPASSTPQHAHCRGRISQSDSVA